MTKPIAIIACANEAYAMPMVVALHSALVHLDPSRQVQTYVLDAGINQETRARCERILETAHPFGTLKWIIPNADRFKAFNARRYSIATFLRLMIPEIVSKEIEKALYVDSDVVVTDDISQLWDIDLEGATHAAVANPNGPHFKDRIDDKFGVAAPDGTPYFNTGVLLMNLPVWRDSMISEKAIAFLQSHSDELSFPDQDAVNAMTVGQWRQLETRWNNQTHRMYGSSRLLGIIHYTSNKPWKRDYTGPMRRTFLQAYVATGWEPWPKALLTAGRLGSEQVLRKVIKRLSKYKP